MSIGPKGQRLNFVNDLNDLWENDKKMETCWDSQSLTCVCANMHFEIAKEENVLWEKIVSRPVKVLGYGFDYTSSFRTPKQSFAHQLVVTTLQRDENDFSHSTTRLPPSSACYWLECEGHECNSRLHNGPHTHTHNFHRSNPPGDKQLSFII